MRKNLLRYLFLIMAISATPSVFAHSFHYEVQVSNELQTNDKRQLEALKLTFLYDGEVSKVMLQDQKDLDKLGKKLIKDLSVLTYFTQAKLNGNVINFVEPSDISLEKITSKGEKGSFDVLQLHFTLALKKSVNITKNSEIAFFHEDPTAAAILYYESAEHISLGKNLKDNCKASVKEKGDFAEGEFPQIVRINCKA